MGIIQALSGIKFKLIICASFQVQCNLILHSSESSEVKYIIHKFDKR